MNPLDTTTSSSSQLVLPNTLGLAAYAPMVVRVREPAQVPELRGFARSASGLFVLGGGSNVVLPAKVQATVARVELTGIQMLASTDEHFLIEAAAGETWHNFVSICIKRGWPGLENLALIPGTVGAAPVQNIGAYGVELSELVHSIQAYDLHKGEWCKLTPAECQFSYRDSVFKRADQGRWLITAVRFALPRHWRPRLQYPDLRARFTSQDHSVTPQAIFDAVCDIRRSKLPDPAVLPNAGSFFKNPIIDVAQHLTLAGRYAMMPAWPQPTGGVKVAAGWLIDQAGWKGRRLGPVGMHERHALVLVNYGGATADDVHALTEAVQRDVHERFGIHLEREPVSP